MSRDAKIAGAVFAAIPLLILGAAIADTWAIAQGASEKWRLLFRAICHGIPARCLVLWGVPMPICARCTAIYAGLILSFVAYLILPRMREQVARMVLYAALVPMAVDGLTQLAGLRLSTNSLRLVTGLLVGVTFGVWAMSAIENHGIVTIP